MHSGARRFVVLDFGSPVMLTDMIVPACCDLVLLSVDVWLCSEEQDGQRLVVASDIATKALVLSDLQPPPICRYLKVSMLTNALALYATSVVPMALSQKVARFLPIYLVEKLMHCCSPSNCTCSF